MSTNKAVAAERAALEDELRLAKLGYKQELKRGLTAFHNFGISFSHISILIGIAPLVGYVMVAGGPAAAVWGWIIAGAFSLCVCSALAEICSAYPTSGGLYYWSAKLGGEEYGPVFAWFNGWFNAVGELAGITGVAYQVSLFIVGLVNIQTPWEYTQGTVVGIAIALLFAQGLLNSLNERLLAHFTEASVFIHVFGSLAIFITLLATSPKLQSASWLFTTVVNETGWESNGFAFLLAFLLPGWTFVGYDASAHVSEETQNSHTAAAKGMIHSLLWSIVGGWLLLIAYFVTIQDYEATLTTSYGFPVVQILVDNAGPVGGSVLLAIITLGSFFCGFSAMTANSRMMYSFARDGAIPKLFYWNHPTTKLPLRTIWLCVLVCSLLLLTALGSPIVLYAFNSVCTIGFNTAYVIPILLRLTVGRSSFKQAEFNLGRFSEVIGWLAVFWAAFLFVLLCFPTSQPVTPETANYAPLMLGSVIIAAAVAWFWARNWFKGPRVLVSEEQVRELEQTLRERGAEPDAQELAAESKKEVSAA
ncbi:amino acid/polyamine transporter I [Hyaloraphidium curvatum]|nr:amino acid/polyamine transporter I [Hyaloraphidium curvatum]